MHGQRIGYIRVSSFDQNPERQLEQVQVDKQFTDNVSAHFDRIGVIMNFYEGQLHKPKRDLVRSLNERLNFRIPSTLPDPESRTWPDPSDESLAISFTCNHPTNRDVVTGLRIAGHQELVGWAINGDNLDNSPDNLTWTLAEPWDRSSTLSPLARAVEECLTKVPGWEFLDLSMAGSRIRVLVRAKVTGQGAEPERNIQPDNLTT